MAYHCLSFNPEHVKYQFFLWRLEDLGLTALCFKNSLRYKQMVLLPMHMHLNKPGERKRAKKNPPNHTQCYPLQDTWQLTPAMSAIF